MPRIRLTFSEGPRAGEYLEVDGAEPGGTPVFFGRSRDSTVTIESPHLSRRHAEIFADSTGRLFIRDAGSINGTIVNGQMVSNTSPTPLTTGDQVQVGDTVFSFDGIVTDHSPALGLRANRMTSSLERERPTNPSPAHLSSPNLMTRPVLPKPPAPEVILTDDSYIYLSLHNGQRYLFQGEEATVGRGQGNDIVIDSNSISRQHARLQRTASGIFVTDLGSTNKTFVNGVLADGPLLLHHGDLVRFGDIEADFHIENERQTGRFSLPDQTIVEGFFDSTQRDFTQPGEDSEDSYNGPGLEKLETALDIDIRDIRVVGRKGRQASDALPELTSTPKTSARGTDLRPPQAIAETFIGQVEVARVEGLYMTEGQGRAAQLMLCDVRMGLRQGELLAIVGPSGSGKSELVQIMAGLIPADKGRVTVLSRNIPTYETAGRRLNLEADKEFVRWRTLNIGYFNSHSQLDPKRPAYEQVMQPMEVAGVGRDNRDRQERAFERLQLVGLLEPEIARLRPIELNRTEKQLVMLARALANDPSLLLCDEPLGNLTSKASNEVFKLLKRLINNGKTILMVTQDQFWAHNASRIIEILDGAIVGSLS